MRQGNLRLFSHGVAGHCPHPSRTRQRLVRHVRAGATSALGAVAAPGASARLAAATTLALALSAIPALAQTPAPAPATTFTLSGTVRVATAPGKVEPIPGVTVLLKGTTIRVSTDQEGHYELVLPAAGSGPQAATIVFTSLGFIASEWGLPSSSPGLLRHDAFLALGPSPLTVFSVRRPSLFQRAKWTLKRWLGKDPE